MDKPTQNTNTIHGLVKRRRDLQAESDYVSGKLAALEADILTLDNAIRLIDPKFNIASIRPKTLKPRTNELRKYQVDVI